MVCLSRSIDGWMIAYTTHSNQLTPVPFITHPTPKKVLSRFEAAPESEHRFLRELLHLLYRDCVPHRPLLRALMARFLVAFARNPRRDAAVGPVLEVSKGWVGRWIEMQCAGPSTHAF